jgi:hypothetical protein
MQSRDMFNEKPAEGRSLMLMQLLQQYCLLKSLCTRHRGHCHQAVWVTLPSHCREVCHTAKNCSFDTILFHRVIENFVIQMGIAPPLASLLCNVRDQRRAPL